jgi:isopenicillin N synthase-like dioxygenase
MYTPIHQIPTLDLTDLAYHHEAPLAPTDYAQLKPSAELLERVREGLKTGDFFQVFGTHIPVRLPHARKATLELFSHPDEVLEQGYGHPEAFRQRGYSPFGGEKAVGMDEVDIYRQFWMTGNLAEREFGGEEDRRFDEIDRDPNELSPEFGGHVRSILSEATHTARVLLRCFEELFSFEPGELVAKTIGADTVTRTLYYTSPKLNAVLAGEHDDINLITILSGDMWGLEVLINGEFHPVLIRPDCILVNLGEMLNQIKGCEHLGRIRHRVVARPGVHNPRIQFATFVHLLRDTVLMNNVRCGDWFAQRIKDIQAK